ncbi:U8 snoRNA-decapping enzyme isoform X1 [Acanthochromis polyacanthus]|uniref:U8 snoRNA-decapping enzyme isoform X1 n=1 Tax=Acanthochromis polyacanthus TaxID=80966 RepID=UPI0022347383|nr:U8 snoRNA-decapping enzyme isoform X1 [Acanthochromis polyacanthus]
MASGQLSRAEALACAGCRHACHVMLYCDTRTQLFGRIPIRHVVLMQMRFDGLLGFPGGLVNPSEETLEAGLSRELSEELGVALPISVEDHVDSCHAPSSSSSSRQLITHFYVKKMEEEQIREVEKAAASTATDHGQEVMRPSRVTDCGDLPDLTLRLFPQVLGMVRVPLYAMQGGDGGLASFLSHSFIGNARSQLIDSLLSLNLVSSAELQKALANSLKIHENAAEDLRAATETLLKLTCSGNKQFDPQQHNPAHA